MARINAVSFHQDPFPESILRKVRDAGFDSLEVSRPPFFEKFTTPGTRRTLAAYARGLGLSLYGFDCWVEVEPYRAWDETLRGFRAAIDFASDLALGMIISHDPWAHVNQDRSPAECLRKTVTLFQEVADLAAARQLKLIFEPHPDTLSMDTAWAIDFIDGLARPNVGLLYDCCHYGVGQPKTYLEAINRLGSRIQHLHFSDGDRRTYALHLPIGEGELDLNGVVATLKATGFRGTLTNDMYNYPLLEDGARRNVERIREVELELGIPPRP
jgi:sugar phosphate isomerase/epimerase